MTSEKILKTVICTAVLSGCGPRVDSELDIIRTQQSSNRKYRVIHQELPDGWARLRLVADYIPDSTRVHAITACFGETKLCERGEAKPEILYLSPEIRQKLGETASAVPNPPDTRAQKLAVDFPSAINVQRGTFINIVTYFVPVGVRDGWILPEQSSESTRSVANTAVDLAEFDRNRQRLLAMPKAERHHETLFMQKDYSFEYQMAAIELERKVTNQMFAQFAANTLGANTLGPLSGPQTDSQPDSSKPLPNGESLDAGEVLNQGNTNYCWGYSAFHMVRAFYLTYAKNSPWAQAIAKLNSHENMATWMRSNFPNRGNNQIPWLSKFRQQYNLPDHGWGYAGSVREAAGNMQGELVVPVSYCDGRHCVALVGVSNGQFEVLDSAGGIKKKKSIDAIGKYNAVTMSMSEARAAAESSETNPLKPSNTGLGMPVSAIPSSFGSLTPGNWSTNMN